MDYNELIQIYTKKIYTDLLTKIKNEVILGFSIK